MAKPAPKKVTPTITTGGPSKVTVEGKTAEQAGMMPTASTAKPADNGWRLLARKCAVAFIVAFIPALITSWQGLSKEQDYKLTSALIISIIIGALGAGVRAVIAIQPFNLVPTDAQHTLFGGGK